MHRNPEIIPLCKDLSYQGFDDYLSSTDFERLCVRLNLSDLWQRARNKYSLEFPFGDDGFFSPREYNPTLAEFLDNIRTKHWHHFASLVTDLVDGFLKWTPGYPEVRDIIADIETISLDERHRKKITDTFSKIENDLIRKAQLLKETAVARATGRGGDDDLYFRLRNSLMQNPVTSPNLPAIIVNAHTLDDFWTAIKIARSGYQPRREFLTDAFNSLFHKLNTNQAPVESSVKISEAYIHDIWQKALHRRSTDPEGAITSARSLLETVCRHIIEIKRIELDESADLPKLYKTAVRQLNLSPEQHTQPVFKQILSGCQSVVEGLGGLRNKYSDAHGKGPRAIKPSDRHAALAVNLAGAMSSFMLSTLERSTDPKRE